MAAIIRSFTGTLSKAQSQQKLTKLLSDGKNKRYFPLNEGSIRYIVENKGEKG